MPETDDVDEALIDYELQGCDRAQLAVVWRTLCASMLLQSAVAARPRSVCQAHADTRNAAKRWLSGGGIVTFVEACESTGLSPEKILRGFHDLNRDMAPINLSRRQQDAYYRGSPEIPIGLVAPRRPVAAGGGGRTGSITSHCGDRLHAVPRFQDRDRR